MDYKARYYDPYLNRFLSPDSIIPDQYDPQSWDRYAYVRNNPINFNDPTGHVQACADGDAGGGCGTDTTVENITNKYKTIKKEYHSEIAWAGLTNAERKALESRGWNEAIWWDDIDTAVSWDRDPVRDIFFIWGALLGFRALPSGSGFTAYEFAEDGKGAAANLRSNNFYTVAYEVELPEGTYPGMSRAVHFNAANKNLLEAIKSDLGFAQGMDDLIPGIEEQISTSRAWSSPNGWTWHHVPDQPGVLQLVPSSEHWSLWNLFHPNNVGGFKLWGD